MTLPHSLFAVVIALMLSGCSSEPQALTLESEVPAATTMSSWSVVLPTGSVSSSSNGPAPESNQECTESPCYSAPTQNGLLDADVIPEASGLAPSSIDPDLFFVVNDAFDTAHIVAIHLDGTIAGQIDVVGMAADNAEALAPGVCNPGSAERCLYVGDIGADPARAEITIYRLPEPKAAELPSTVSSDAWTYRYPDGEYNAEALLVGDDGSVIVITKPDRGSKAHRVYTGEPGGGELVLNTTFTPAKPARPRQSLLVGNVVTDASRLSDRVLLLFYDQAIEYLAPTPGADPAQFPDWEFRQLAIPIQPQSEGVTYLGAAGGAECGYLVVSEEGPVGGQPAIGSVACTS